MVKATLKYTSHVNEVTKDIGSSVSIAVEKSLAVMELNIKKNTPKVTGNLARAIRYQMNEDRISGEVHNIPVLDGEPIDYAVFVEYGTKHMAPRAMFRKGVAQSQDRIVQIFADELKK